MRDTEDVVRRGKRRRFTKEYRRQVVQETLAPGASIAGVALKHRLNANLVFTWRRRLLPALAPARARSVKLLPVTITDSGAPAPADETNIPRKPVRRYRTRGVIEIELNGARLVVKGAVDAEALRVVLAALASR
ncbi:MAG: IS66-like element accessory protein TnpA [Burkholderiales bacterium]